MDYNIFKTDEERRNAIQRLGELQESEGWQILLKALDINIGYFDEVLHTEPFTELRAVERLQDRLSDLYKLKQLPILLAEDANEKLNPQTPADDSDPYDNLASELTN